MNRITYQGLLSFNRKINDKFPDQGTFCVINEDNLKSALSVFDSYYDYEEQIAAALFRSLLIAHGFQNANKRTAFCAVVACKTPTIDGDDLEKLAIDISQNSHVNIDELATIMYGKTRTPINNYDFEFTEAMEKHDELNQKLFNDNELDSKVKDKLLEIVDKFKDNLESDNVKLDIKDVVIVGSSASYNYTKDSDIDLHIVADLSVYPNQEELAGKLYNAYKALFNNKYDPTIYGIPVEVYVEPEGMKANSKGRYSLYNGWVNKPEKEDIPETPDISSEVDEWGSKANKCSTIEEIDDFLDSLYQARQSSLISDGEFGVGNLVFKELRNNGTIQELKDKKVELENKEMSLGEACNSVGRIISEDSMNKNARDILIRVQDAYDDLLNYIGEHIEMNDELELLEKEVYFGLQEAYDSVIMGESLNEDENKSTQFIDPEIWDQLTIDQQDYIDDNDLSLQVVDGIIILGDLYEDFEFKSVDELKSALDYDIQESEKLGF